MPRPDLAAVKAYLEGTGQPTSWEDGQIQSALDAEVANQARTCRVPSPAEFYPTYAGDWISGRVYPVGTVVGFEGQAWYVTAPMDPEAAVDDPNNYTQVWGSFGPILDGWDAFPDLAEALLRRVARNLAIRPLPLGYQTSATDAAVIATRIGGLDAEIRRFEAPRRRAVFG